MGVEFPALNRFQSLGDDLIRSILKFLPIPPTGVCKRFEFQLLSNDRDLFIELQKKIPLFSFLRGIEISPIDQSLGVRRESARINAFFTMIKDTAELNLEADLKKTFQTRSRDINLYKELNKIDEKSQNYDFFRLGEYLSTIPSFPRNNQNYPAFNQDYAAFDEAERAFYHNFVNTIRAWFENPKNQAAVQTITQLDFDSDSFKHIPPEIGQLKNLRSLEVKDNDLSFLPLEIGELKKLKKLDLSNNYLSFLPTRFSELVNLEELYLCENYFSKIPEQIFLLEKLKELYIRNSDISDIPQKISDLKNLKTLNLSGCKISNLPNLAELPMLKYLCLSDNSLSILNPQILPISLKGLYLEGNKISYIDSTIALLKDLKELYLKDNELTTIPHEIVHLNKLENLDLSQNQIDNIPKNIFDFLKTINKFNMENQIKIEDPYFFNELDGQQDPEDSSPPIVTSFDQQFSALFEQGGGSKE